MKFKTETVVVHNTTVDATVGAWIANNFFTNEQIKIHSIEDTETLEKLFFKKCKVIFIGLIVPFDYYALLRKDNNNQVIIIDNKSQSKKQYEKYINDPNIKISTNSSCSLLTWRFFHGDTYPLRGVQYIDEYITGKGELSGVNHVYCYLTGRELTMDVITSYMDSVKDLLGQGRIVEEGKIIEKYINYLVDKNTMRVNYAEIGGVKVPFICCTKTIAHEIANKMSKDHYFACAWYIDDQGCQQVILKSHKDGVDVDKIANRYGGRGHSRSAHFTITRKDFFIL